MPNVSNFLTITLQNRKAFKKILDRLSVEQVNIVPKGFNNNIIWNCGHIIAVQQFLMYGLTNNTFFVNNDFVSSFTMGTRPTQFYDKLFIDELKSLLFTSIDHLQNHLLQEKTLQFNSFTTAIKVEIRDVKTALAFNQYHEAIHMGYVLSLMKFV